MMDLVFEWDDEKEQKNLRLHGLEFETATRVFFDPRRIERYDKDSSIGEDRYQTMGVYENVLFVVYTERGNVTRIISARKAEPFERRIYYGNSEIHGWERVAP